MSVTIVVGGQYGSEGKGKVAALLGAATARPWHVRCGGPNSGHTVTLGEKEVVLRQVPTSIDPSNATFCLAAGCVVDEDILISELQLLEIDRERIIIDPRAVIITPQDRIAERETLSHISSTYSGTGAAMIRRMSRSNDTLLAGNSDLLKSCCRVETVAPLIRQAASKGTEIIVEGSQGFGLSLLHGPDYPFVTSRDTTASGFAMEVGLSPLAIHKIIVVLRTFPIRVGGSSGPLPDEISWEAIAQLSGAPIAVPEFTSVTKRLRRVAKFDFGLAKMACQYNQPTSLALMGTDRLEYANNVATNLSELGATTRNLIDQLENETGVPVEFLGTGFRTLDAIRVANHSRLECAHV